MGRKEAEDLRQSFRSARGQDQIAHRDAPHPKKKPVENSVKSVDNSKKRFVKPAAKKSSEPYQEFLEKYHNIDLRIDDFTPRDLMYYFKEISRKNKCNYVIANMNRDIGVMKRVLEDRSPREICAMIEFIFESGQKYIDVRSVQPTILSHSISNKIYGDMSLWVEDQYVPEEETPKPKQVVKKREFQDTGEKFTSIDRIDKKR